MSTTYYVRSRTTSPLVYTTVDAETREQAIAKTVETAAPGEQIEVLQVQTMPFAEAGVTGATGATGA